MDWVDIPSDSQSVDGQCGSDVDDISFEDQAVQEQETDSECDEISNSDDDSEDEPLIRRLENLDSIWKTKSKRKDDLPFTINCGPNIPSTATTPLDIFFCLLPQDFVELIVHHTNLYAMQTETKPFVPVTKEEMLRFLGVNILMEVKQLPSYRDYWSVNEQLNDSYISNLMTVNRFGFLLSHLHLNDNS